MSGETTAGRGPADTAGLPSGVRLRAWADGDDLALLEVWGDPVNAQQHQDRSMLAADSTSPWRRTLVAEEDGVPVAAGTVFHSTVHPRRLWTYVETAPTARRRGIGSALLNALRAEASAAHAAGAVPSTALKTRFAKNALVAATSQTQEGEDADGEASLARHGLHEPERTQEQTARLAEAAEAFLVRRGFAPVQRSRRVAIAPGSLELPSVRDEQHPDGLVFEEAATGSVELTQAVVDFYDAVHDWDPSAMSLGAAQNLLLGPSTGAAGAVVQRERPKEDGGAIRAFAVSYTAQRQDEPADVLLGWDPQLSEPEALQAVADMLAVLVAQHPVQVEVDEAMAPLERIVDGLEAAGAARTLVDAYVFVDDADSGDEQVTHTRAEPTGSGAAR